ncbi:hypothetical protein B9Z55_012714 [Caenorhabditis nigoni]|nr:hypothetical protein B9Z55_012714 [Caenorhabditis nigoni]
MNAEMYKKYMMKVLPMIVKATPAGREAVLVIDNASIHNSVVEKVFGYLRKANLQSFIDSYQEFVKARIAHFSINARHLIKRISQKELLRYEVDEYAASLGVRIVRIPPYHCQFSPIELVWHQLKDHLRSTGKSSDKLEAVRERAINYLKNKSESDILFTYEHVRDIEDGIKSVMEIDEKDSDDSDSDTD